jgi:RNA-directed DNA polymerase
MVFENRLDWFQIEWPTAFEKVIKIQNDIVVAYECKDLNKVKVLQNNLVGSFAARCIAVRTITTNKGRNTPGVDKIKNLNPTQKMELVFALKNIETKKPSPVRRVWISKDGKPIKPDKSNGRPLGIPSIFDRAAQSLWNLALSPIAECTGDRHSYGFRPQRSTQDAMLMLYLRLATRYRPMWVLEADIKGFYDNITHEWILKNIPMEKKILKGWLQAGYIDVDTPHETTSGVPQGGPISPTIANMVLDGLSEHIKKVSTPHSKRGDNVQVTMVRYADDFVITGKRPDILKEVIKPAVDEFLKERGLWLNVEKTIITNLRDGFDFLGFNFRVYARKEEPDQLKLLIKPSKVKVKALLLKIKNVFKKNQHSSALALIMELNPLLRGWGNYYRTVVSKKIFSKIDWYVWHSALRWAKKRHRGSSHKQLLQRYFKRVENTNLVFYGRQKETEITVFRTAYLPIKRHMLIRNLNPFLIENNDYFLARRHRQNWSVWDKRRWDLLKKSRSICVVCNQPIVAGEDLEKHHTLPKRFGGEDRPDNLMALHKECHHQVTYTKKSRHTCAICETRSHF